jgi:hypothetical protein
MKYTLIRVWRRADFTLKLWDTHRTDRYGKSVLAYKLYDNGRVIFRGEDFHNSPLHAIDSLETVEGLLAFLTLRPGDTDPDYFESYTLRQLAWCRSVRCELLGFIRLELEEKLAARRRARHWPC